MNPSVNANRRISDRYEISDAEKGLLGRGGMGDVYRATETARTFGVDLTSLETFARGMLAGARAQGRQWR